MKSNANNNMNKSPSSRSATSLGNGRKTLEFWHKVEFFIPFNLDRELEQIKDVEKHLRYLTKEQLQKPTIEPLWQADSPPEKELSGFDLYLGLFDIAKLAEAAKEILGDTLSENEVNEEAERGELKGTTCFARIKLNPQGIPLLKEVSVSTVPWALGVIQRDGVSGLSSEAFQDGQSELKKQLKHFQEVRNDRVPQSEVEKNGSAENEIQVSPLSETEISSLLEIFYCWAAYHPDGKGDVSPVALIRAKFKSPSENVQTPHKNNRGQQTADSTINHNDTESDDAEEEEESSASGETEIAILNSFYCRDIERAIDSIDAGSALATYLTPANEKMRLDLYSPAGREFIVNNLEPRFLNHGRWLDESDHGMSLMQQFSIGKILGLSEGEVFSVNGPPGTGKTTMLREVFAENVTRRAKILAGYASAAEAFQTNSATVNFLDEGQSHEIRLLKSELTGFEMVVASSNNAAVENISHDLPKLKALGEKAWLTPDGASKIGYLQGVAHKVASQDNKNKFKTLKSHEVPWGLISCALGRKGNREKFAKSIRFPGKDENKLYPYGLKKPYVKGFDPNKHQSIWTWSKSYKGPTFSEARAAFEKAEAAVENRIGTLQELADISSKLQGETQKSFTQAAERLFVDARQAQKFAQSQVGQLENDLLVANSQLESFQELARLHNQKSPGFISSLLGLQKAKEHKLELEQIRARQREQLMHKVNLTPKLETAKMELRGANDTLALAEAGYTSSNNRWNKLNRRMEQLRAAFPDAEAPANAESIEEEKWQIGGVWRDKALNQLRSELFAAALQLHEAWLAEALGHGFTKNIISICDVLSGRRPTELQNTLSIWQSLFMVVPIISSTFASIGSQFRDIGGNALGWLFIDEAGQAVPQAAVGAIWRCKRAVIVGDPLQIEPVFTVPIRLIEALFKSSGLPNDMKVMPHRVSCQNLADAANTLGTSVAINEDKKEWIGSPLRVHRRCADPMFMVANSIAYHHKMVHGRKDRNPPPDSLDIGGSAWVNVSGATSHKQVVPEQIDVVFRALVALFQAQQELPPLYIISPFRQVKAELIRTLSDMKRWQAVTSYLPTKTALSKWCEGNIGTVHTFQGKENSIVWMVLGGDANTPGAVSWAASKPNILNVALTRAQHRFFMIGDANIWGDMNYFREARESLYPIITFEEFMLRIKNLASLKA